MFNSQVGLIANPIWCCFSPPSISFILTPLRGNIPLLPLMVRAEMLGFNILLTKPDAKSSPYCFSLENALNETPHPGFPSCQYTAGSEALQGPSVISKTEASRLHTQQTGGGSGLGCCPSERCCSGLKTGALESGRQCLGPHQEGLAAGMKRLAALLNIRSKDPSPGGTRTHHYHSQRDPGPAWLREITNMKRWSCEQSLCSDPWQHSVQHFGAKACG